MPERLERAVLDTSVVIDLERLDVSSLPQEMAVTAITMAELAAGPHATADATDRARRQDRLQRAEAAFDPLPFDAAASRAYGRIYAAVIAQGRKARGARAEVDARLCGDARVGEALPRVAQRPRLGFLLLVTGLETKRLVLN